MIRATILSTIDQALLSLLSFGIAAAMVHWAGTSEYGLYSQVNNFQGLLTALNSGVFVSAVVSKAAGMGEHERTRYLGSMARWELTSSPVLAVIAAGTALIVGRAFGVSLSTAIAMAFALSLLGQWIRDFSRQAQFSRMNYSRALAIDAAYSFLLVAAMLLIISAGKLTTTTLLMAMGGAAALAALPFAVRLATEPRSLELREMQTCLQESWAVGRWESIGTLVTWAYSQTYIFVAAMHGGLSGAGEMAAARLMATPLSLTWLSYSNVLRPRASQLLANGDSRGVRRIAFGSVLVVLAMSACYAALFVVAAPTIGRFAFGSRVPNLRILGLWWIAYTAACGLTTIAASILRSAQKFRLLFAIQVASSLVALTFVAMSLAISPTWGLIFALLLAELISASITWHFVAKSARDAKQSHLQHVG